MSRKLLIVGSDGLGRNCLDIALHHYDEIAFLNDNWMVREVNGYKVIGGFHQLDSFYPEYTDVFIAIEDNRYRNKLFKQAKRAGYNFPSLISEKSYVSSSATIGKGTVILPNAVIEANAFIGDCCIIASNTTINSKAFIEDGCLIKSNTVIGPNAHVYLNTKIGSNCTIGFAKNVYAESNISDGTVI